MVKFVCICGHNFELPEELAGSQLQCPQCGRLVDVPTLDDLRALGADGTYLVEEQANPLTSPQRLEQLHRAWTREKVDHSGQEIDLRLKEEDFAAAGVQDVPLVDESHRPLSRPRYDPITGELLRPLPVAQDDTRPPGPIPMAKATLTYATGNLNQPLAITSPLMAMLSPVNLATMFFVLLAQMVVGSFLVAILTFTLVGAGSISVGTGPIYIAILFALTGAVIAHYANVIEDIGPDEKDELPRFMRHFSLSDDIWRPFCNAFVALAYCFLPLLIALAAMNWKTFHAQLSFAILGGCGIFIFPAVALTSATSGSVLNLRPDRVLYVIWVMRFEYLVPLLAFLIAVPLYAAGMLTTTFNTASIISWSKVPWFFTAGFAYSTLAGGIYFMHYFCWELGLAYRRHHVRFDWVLQWHHRPDPMEAKSRRRPYTGLRRPAEKIRP